MEFPRRTDEHIKETDSYKVLQLNTPKEWIIRDFTERDYGVDLYIELIGSSGTVSGDLCFIQLKGAGSIQWRDAPETGSKYLEFSGTRKSTINYWMSLPVPVFLILSDLSNRRAYFSPVKRNVRERYSRFTDPTTKTMGFHFPMTYELGTNTGQELFCKLYHQEKNFPYFIVCSRDLLINMEHYRDFVWQNQNRDEFLEVEVERRLTMEHIYHLCEFLSGYLGLQWNVMKLSDLYNHDSRAFGHEEELHEASLTKLLAQLEAVFVDLVERVRILLMKEQRAYWSQEDKLLFRMCLNVDTKWLKRPY